MKSIDLWNLKLSSISGIAVMKSASKPAAPKTKRGQETRKRLKTALIKLLQERAYQEIRLEVGRRQKEADPLAMIYQN
jgi:hypothetical protein